MNGETKYYTLIQTRYIHDFDGFMTELSIWEEVDLATMETVYFIVYGDTELYGPVEGEDFDMSYADWAEEDFQAAMDFFYDYDDSIVD